MNAIKLSVDWSVATLGGWRRDRPPVERFAEGAPEVRQADADVVDDSDGGEGAVSDALVVDDCVARDEDAVDDQRPLVGEWRHDACFERDADAGHSLRSRRRRRHSIDDDDPITNLRFVCKCGVQSWLEQVHGGVQVVQVVFLAGVAGVVVVVVGVDFVQIDVLHEILLGHQVDEVAGRERDSGAALRFDGDKVALFVQVAVEQQKHLAEYQLAVGRNRLNRIARLDVGNLLATGRRDDRRVRREASAVPSCLRRFYLIKRQFNCNQLIN